MFSDLSLNCVFNIIEYFSYLNLWLIILFFFILMFFLLLISSSSLLCSKLCAESTFESWLLIVFIFFVSIILFPLFDIMFDYESIIGSSCTLYSLGYQWAWLFGLSSNSWFNYFNSNSYSIMIDSLYYIPFNTVDSYVLSSYYSSYFLFYDYFILDLLSSLLSSFCLVDLCLFDYGFLFVIYDLINSCFDDLNCWFIDLIYDDWLLFFYSDDWLFSFYSSFLSFFYSSYLGFRFLDFMVWLLFFDYAEWVQDCSQLYYFIINSWFSLSFNMWFLIYDYWFLMFDLFLCYFLSFFYSFLLSNFIYDFGFQSFSSSASNIYHYDLYLNYYSQYYETFGSIFILPLFASIKLCVYSYDVIHSFGIYSLGIKMDAIPGRFNMTSCFRTNVKGELRGFCYELCGYSHSTMLILGLVL